MTEDFKAGDRVKFTDKDGVSHRGRYINRRDMPGLGGNDVRGHLVLPDGSGDSLTPIWVPFGNLEKLPPIPMSYWYTDVGFCRVLYKSKGGRVFCLQDEGDNFGILFYACSADEEPSHECKTNGVEFEKSPGTTELDVAVNAFIDKLGSAG